MKARKQFAEYFFFVMLLVSGILATSCSRKTPEILPPEEIVQRSAQFMGSLDSFHFVIERSGAPAYLDLEKTIIFRRAEGDFIAPDQAQAVVRIVAPGLVAEVQMRARDGRYWETDLLAGTWKELPYESGFNPAILFNPQTGFQSVLTRDITELRLEGTENLEDLPGQTLYRVSGLLYNNRISSLSYGMIVAPEFEIDLWISPGSFALQRVLITVRGEEGSEDMIWKIDFWNFNQAPTITPPDNGP